MPDEAVEAPEVDQDTPVAEVEETEAEAPANTDNWEQRYNDLRPEFDRRNQLLTAAEGHQGPDAQAQALRQLGVEVELEQEEEAQDDWVDPDERIDRLEQAIAERDQAAEESQWAAKEESFIDSTLTELESSEGVKLTDPELQFVVTNALSDRDPQSGEPNLKGAFDAIKEIRKEAGTQYLASKKTPAAPLGSAGEQKIDFKDGAQRRKFMAEDLASRMES